MPETNGNQPATRADLQALEDRVVKAIANATAIAITNAIAQSQSKIVDQMHEFVRDTQTELLRGFEAFSIGHNVRMRKIQADLSNVDAGTNQRLLAVENRLLQIEKRLPLLPPQQ
jgi:hypothetical protein